VYYFTKEISSGVISELLKNPTRASFVRTQIRVYRVDENGGLALIPNQPFKTKREALRVLVIHSSVLNNHLDSSIVHKGLLIFSFQHSDDKSK